MKAIRKSDGKIIDVEVHGFNNDKNCPVSYHTNFKDFYKPEDLDFNIPQETEQSSSFDWQSFRAEAAKDILCQVITLEEVTVALTKARVSKERAVSIAISYADELIRQLKEREKK